MLACINEQEATSDYKEICADPKAQECLNKRCSSENVKPALAHFSSVCKSKNLPVGTSRRPFRATPS